MPSRISGIVINTSPLVALDSVGQLLLLPKVYDGIVIPQAVAEELGDGPRTAKLIQNSNWLRVRKLAESPANMSLLALGRGESEVILLAQQSGIEHVLIDERKARRAAHVAGLKVSGTVGVILRAKRLGHLAAVKPVLEELRQCGLWLSRDLISRTLEWARE